MKKNKITIDLGNLDLSEKEKQKLLNAVHKTVTTALKAQPAVQPGLPAAPSKATPSLAAAAGASAAINVNVTGTDPGLTEIKAAHNGLEKTLDQSGDIVFDNVLPNETIRIQGKSLGSVRFKIDREAEPQRMAFDPGTFRFHFFILT